MSHDDCEQDAEDVDRPGGSSPIATEQSALSFWIMVRATAVAVPIGIVAVVIAKIAASGTSSGRPVIEVLIAIVAALAASTGIVCVRFRRSRR